MVGQGIVPGVAGILLTGGASKRMGFDKASILIEGITIARRLAGVLAAVTALAVEVGPGHSGLPAVTEEPAGAGPLVAVGAGHRALRARGHLGPALLIACDLPHVDEAVLRLLAAWPGTSSVVPVVEGQPQPLCARWSFQALDKVASHVSGGDRSMRPLLDGPGVLLLEESEWSPTATSASFVDVDRPEDLERLGLPSSAHASVPRSRD
ncbi:MAG: molybdenum cofactor guanylyltransferase [Acidimicrobiales bacterium]